VRYCYGFVSVCKSFSHSHAGISVKSTEYTKLSQPRHLQKLGGYTVFYLVLSLFPRYFLVKAVYFLIVFTEKFTDKLKTRLYFGLYLH